MSKQIYSSKKYRKSNNKKENFQYQIYHLWIINYNNKLMQQHDTKQVAQNKQGEESQESGEAMDYYKEFCKLFLTNKILSTQLEELNFERQELVNKLAKIEKKNRGDGGSQQGMFMGRTPNNTNTQEEKKRRVRRTASEIHRHYNCEVSECRKSYGSQGSLNQHIKLKHPELIENGVYKINMNLVEEIAEESDSK